MLLSANPELRRGCAACDSWGCCTSRHSVLNVPLSLAVVYMSIDVPARQLAPDLRQGARNERLQPGRPPIRGPKARHCRGLE